MNLRYLSAAALIAASSLCANGNIADSISDLTLGLDVRPARIIPTCNFLKTLEGNDKVNAGVMTDLSLSFRFSKESRTGRLYPHAYQGIGLGVLPMTPSRRLGTPVTLYLFQGSRLASLGSRLSLDYEWNFGLSAGWKKVDNSDIGPESMMGSRFNAYLNLGVMLHYRLSRRLQLTGGIEASHFSDGNSALPNPGVNSAGVRIGVAYNFNPSEETAVGQRPKPAFDRVFNCDVMAFGAPTQQSVMLPGETSPTIVPGKFFAGGISVMPLYRLTPVWSLGASVDMTYNEGSNLQRNLVEESTAENIRFLRQPFSQRFSTGIALHAEFNMPIFTINAGIGRNVIARGSNSIFYQTLALKTYVCRGVFLNIGYQLRNFKEPHHLMLGAGYTIGR